MNLLKVGVVVIAALVTMPSKGSATDWEDCANTYKFSPMLLFQGCRVVVQNVPDLNPNETDGPLGFRYKRGKSKWCRIRAECPRFVCDGALLHERDIYGSTCLSGSYTAITTRATASVRIGDADEARWCPPARPGEKWYIATSCRH